MILNFLLVESDWMYSIFFCHSFIDIFVYNNQDIWYISIILIPQSLWFFRNFTMKTPFQALVAILLLEMSAQWKNEWDRPLNFQCPSNKFYIYQIVSIHDNKKEDRLFDFSCLPVHEVSEPVFCSVSGIFLKNIISYFRIKIFSVCRTYHLITKIKLFV